MCSSETTITRPASMVGLPWSIPRALRPQSTTAWRRDTLITVASIQSAGTNAGISGAYAVSISA